MYNSNDPNGQFEAMLLKQLMLNNQPMQPNPYIGSTYNPYADTGGGKQGKSGEGSGMEGMMQGLKMMMTMYGGGA